MFRRRDPLRAYRTRQKGWVLLSLAAFLLLLLAAAQGYVSWRAQFTFIDAAKHSRLPSSLEALGLDTGAVIFALLGLAHARMGKSAAIERILNIACALGSMTMNLLSADLGSPRSIAVYVLPAVLYAACSDRLIATAAHASGVQETSMWRWVGKTFLYTLRFGVAMPSTAKGMRYRLLQLTPLPDSAAYPGTSSGTELPTTFSASLPSQPGAPQLEAPPSGDGQPRHRKGAGSGPKARKSETRSKPLEDVLAAAEEKFGDRARAGDLPPFREVKNELGVGQGRAETARAHLATLMADLDQEDAVRPPAPPSPDTEPTETFTSAGLAGPGQLISSYQHLPVTPQV